MISNRSARAVYEGAKTTYSKAGDRDGRGAGAGVHRPLDVCRRTRVGGCRGGWGGPVVAETRKQRVVDGLLLGERKTRRREHRMDQARVARRCETGRGEAGGQGGVHARGTGRGGRCTALPMVVLQKKLGSRALGKRAGGLGGDEQHGSGKGMEAGGRDRGTRQV